MKHKKNFFFYTRGYRNKEKIQELSGMASIKYAHNFWVIQ